MESKTQLLTAERKAEMKAEASAIVRALYYFMQFNYGEMFQ